MLVVYATALASALIDFALAAWVLLRRPGPIDTDRLVPAALAFSLGLVLKASLGMMYVPRFGFFGGVLLAFVDLALALPLLGLLTLRLGRRRGIDSAVRDTALASLLLVPLAGWSMFVEPFRLVVERTRVELRTARDLGREVTLGVLADLQARAVGDHERAAVAALLELEPDLILIPGDLAQVWPRHPDEALDEFHALISELHAPLGVYMVLGNTDDRAFVRRVVAGTRVQLLEDELAQVPLGASSLWIGGIGARYGGPAAERVAAQLEAAGEAQDVRILLAHFPDAIDLLERPTRVDLCVVGHTHGGQIQVPFFGPPLTLTSVPRRVAAGGLHELDGRTIYVSRGVGAERVWAPRVRLFCRPEVSLLELASPSD